MPACKFCGKEAKLCRAHIWPKSWINRDEMLHQLEIDGGSHPKRRSVGLYDDSFICSDCDGQFGDDETYTGRLFNKFRFRNDTWNCDENGIIYINDVEWERCYRCFMFLAWKAHQSCLVKYSFGDIIADRFRDTLGARPTAIPLTEHEIVVSYYHDFDSDGDLFIPPQNAKFGSKDGYRNVVGLPIGRCMVYIRTDRRRFQNPTSEFVFRKRAILFPVGFSESGMYQSLAGVVHQNLQFKDRLNRRPK